MPRPAARIDLDVETYSEVDLRDVGSYAYAQHPSTDVLCVAWALRGFPTKPNGKTMFTWRPGKNPGVSLFDAISNGVRVHCHNAQFDAEVWRWVLHEQYGWPWPGYDAFVDTQAIGQIYNLPGKLDAAAKFVGGRGKNADGYKLMLKMCKPARVTKNLKDPRRNHTPENIEKLTQYCIEDVEAEGLFVDRVPYFTSEEERVWRETWRMNLRGVKVDYDLVDTLLVASNGAQEHYRDLLAEATDGAIQKETQRKALGAWLVREGARLPLTDKGNPSFSKDSAYLIDMAAASDRAKDALELYEQLNNSSLSKLNKMILCGCTDGRIRGMFRYSGAGQTGRWAGQAVQLQNLPRGIIETFEEYENALSAIRCGADWQDLEFLYDGNALDICSTLIRCCLVPEDGHHFAVADYSAIEGRVLAWEAGETAVLDAYKEGKRMYAVDAAAIFGCSYEQVVAEKAAGNSYKDKVGKVANLALGYQGSVGAFVKMGGRKLGLTEDRIKDIVAAWRTERRQTVQYWYDLQEAATRALSNPGRAVDVGPVSFGYNGADLMMRLPSGRKLYYHRAHITEKTWPDGGTSPQITYFGVDSGRVGWINSYGGKFCENCLGWKTLVVTFSGVKRLQDVAAGDLVWDGVEWVSHDGFIDQGKQEVIEWQGVHLTEDHLILAGEKWQPAIALDERATRDALIVGRASAHLWLSRLTLGNTLSPSAAAIVARNVQSLYATSPAKERSNARSADGRKQAASALAVRSLVCLAVCWIAGAIATQAWSLAAQIPGTGLTTTMAEGVSLCILLGWLIAPHSSSMLQRSRYLMRRASTWTASIMAATTNPATYGSLPVARTPETGERKKCSSTGSFSEASASHAKTLERITAASGGAERSNTTSAKAGAPKKSLAGTLPVGDLKNAGPRKRFTILTDAGPAIVHNCTQAIARDLLAYSTVIAAQEGYNLVMTVHDELVSEEPITGRDHTALCQIMAEVPDWARGIPVKAEGFTGLYYRKG